MTEHLPAGWTWATLDDVIVSMRNGISTKPVGTDGIPILRISAVRPNVLDLTDIRYLETEPDGNVDYTLCTGDLLFTRYNGTRSLVGVCAYVPEGVGRVVYPDKLIRVRVNEALACPRYVQFVSNSGVSRAFIESRARTTAGQTGVSGGDLRAMPLPLPPLPEQRRIVAALEEHLSALDAAVAGLVRARANIARYRAAVLDEAMHAGEDALPAGWRWTSLGEISEVQGGIQKQPKRAPVSNHYPFLRVANVHRGRLVLDELHRIELFGAELSRLRLVRGDLLIVEGNGSQGEIGRMAVWDGSIENCVHQNHIIRARPRDGVLSEYLAFYWNSPSGARRVQAVASSTSGLHTLSVAKVKGIPVPLPPFEEQRRIVESVGLRLAVADRTLADLDVQRARAARLRQSIFQRAFSGALVPQDSAEAAASIVPEPDRTERSSAPASSRPTRGRGRSARTGSRRG